MRDVPGRGRHCGRTLFRSRCEYAIWIPCSCSGTVTGLSRPTWSYSATSAYVQGPETSTTARIQLAEIPPDGAAVRPTILRDSPFGACAVTGNALSANSLGPSTLTGEHAPSSHLHLGRAPAVACQLSCHVLPHQSQSLQRSWQSPPRAEN